MVSKKWFGANGYTLEEPFIGSTGIPQGDGASPIILAFMIWPGFQEVQERLTRLGGTFTQGIYMDDRTVIADRPDIIEEAILAWEDFSNRRHLIENPQKAQKVSVALPVEGYGSCMEVLGSIIGKGSLGGTPNPKQTERIEKALHLIRRIGILPEARWKRLQDIYIFVHGVYSYGWITGAPNDQQAKAIYQHTFRSVGRFKYGFPTLKKLLLMVHMDLQERVFIHQIRLLAKRNLALQMYGLQHHVCTLDFLVYQGLIRYGWTLEGQTWRRGLISFALHDCLAKSSWNKVSHSVRESIRQWHYDQLAHNSRHELEGAILPPYSSERISLVRKWARNDTLAMLLSTGAVQSGRVWAMWNQSVRCPKCAAEAVPWEHFWICGVGVAPPEDVLLRRFLWPRTPADFPLIQQFMDYIKVYLEAAKDLSHVDPGGDSFSQHG